jgi:hypothetical protein
VIRRRRDDGEAADRYSREREHRLALPGVHRHPQRRSVLP